MSQLETTLEGNTKSKVVKKSQSRNNKEQGNQKAHWCLTVQISDEIETEHKKKWLLNILEKNCKKWVFLKEYGETTGNIHFQVQIHLIKKQRFTAVQKLFFGAHIEETGNLEKSLDYCTKTLCYHDILTGKKIDVKGYRNDVIKNYLLWGLMKKWHCDLEDYYEFWIDKLSSDSETIDEEIDLQIFCYGSDKSRDSLAYDYMHEILALWRDYHPM